MSEHVEAAATSGSAPALLGTERAEQRALLKNLVQLAADVATAETTLHATHKSTLGQLEKLTGKKLFDINQQFEAKQRQLAEEFADRSAKAAEAYSSSAAELAAGDASARQKVELEHEHVVQEVAGKLQQAIWLAESVYEATQNQLTKELKKAKEDHATRTEESDGLTEQSAAALALFNQRELFGALEPQPIELNGVSYEQRLDEVKQTLHRLEHLTIPRLFVGLRPYLLFLLFCAVGAVAGQLIASGVPADVASFQLNARQVGIWGGGAAVVGIIAAVLLRLLARRQVRAGYIPLFNALEAARFTADAALEDARAMRDAKAQRSIQQRNNEIQSAREKVAPVQQRIAQKHAASLTALQQDLAHKSGILDDQRRQREGEVNNWQARALASVTQAYQGDLGAARKQHQHAFQAADTRRDRERGELETRWNAGLSHIQTADASSDGVATSSAPERFSEWSNWTPPASFSRRVRFGELHVDIKQITDSYPREFSLPPTFSVPAMLTFPSSGSLLIHTDHAGRAEAIDVQQTLMARLLMHIPPGRVRFTIIDPVGLGQNFAGFMKLADHDEALVGTRIWTEAEHIEQQLANLTEHMETVIQKYLRNEFATIDDYNAQAGELAEPYRFLIISDFPVGFDGDSFRRLNSIATSGARCGVFFIIVRDVRATFRGGAQLDELESNAINLDRKGDRFVWRDEIFKQFPLLLDTPPTEEFFNETIDQIGQRAKEAKRVEVAFDAIMPKLDEIWSRDSATDLVVPIGRLGATRLQTMKLGRGVAQHTLIAGKTGSGKSTLLHVLITNLALWYGPDQVEFYLVDFKKGVEFKTYATHSLPHARAVAVESDREFGLSLLQRIDAELAARGELFRKLGVQDLAAYRIASGQPMPRTLLIIDEFQEFFSEDDKLAQEAGLLLDRLVRQGRAFGVHVLLGSQTIGGSSGLARSTLGQMAVRIALQTSEADSQLILGDSNMAARLLSRPGEAIYNDAGGLVESNSPFQISWLPDPQREKLLQRLYERARVENVRWPQAIVFEGNSRADITQNRQLTQLLSRQVALGGAPKVWLGDPVAIKDPTSVSFRQQSGANLIIIGQNEDAGLALLSSALVSLSAQKPDAKFVLLDGTPTDSVLTGRLEAVAKELASQTNVVEWRNVGDALAELAGEIQQRQGADHRDFTPIYLVIAGLQRFRVLRKSEESFGGFGIEDVEKKIAPDKAFADILREGAAVGVHVLTTVDTAASIERTLDRGAMREFDQRVLFQMSANDSSNLIDSPAANRLGFYRALVFSEEHGTVEKFRPYALLDPAWLRSVSRK